MKYIINHSTDPYYNLALDEYVLKYMNTTEDVFFLWQNDNAIIIGNNQSAAAEINAPFVKDKHIKVARRVSGGGAVYHDLGNLNWTIITNIDDPKQVNYKKYAQPVIDALKKMGVEAEISGRNDITINGLKVSGQAQSLYKKRLMHHGTLLFDVNLETLVEALNVDPNKIVSKGIQSIRSRVTNIKEHLPVSFDIKHFWDYLQYYLSNEGRDEEIKLTEMQQKAVQQLRDEKFSTDAWIYAKSPEFSIKNEKRFDIGKIEIYLLIKDGYIKQTTIQGDFLGLIPIHDIERALNNTLYHYDAIKNVLDQFDLSLYFGAINQTDLTSLFFGK